MRRLLNFCLMLVLVGAVGFLLFKAKLLPFGDRTEAAPSTQTEAQPPVQRDSLRISVAQRPELLMVSALKRLLEVENRKIEIVAYDPESVWLELAAGEIDLVIAPLGEAVTAQGRFGCGRFLFLSGLSEGYDVILARAALTGPPKTLGISGGRGSELFALQKFPDARLVNAPVGANLQAWLNEGAIQAAMLESASLKGELAKSGVRLGATSAANPMPTVVVLSRALVESNSSTEPRLEVLQAALESWAGLISYLDSQPELLRSTLKKEADDRNIDVDILLKDYRFLGPSAGRAALLLSAENGTLKETLELLVLAGLPNLSAPDWSVVLELPTPLEGALADGSANVAEATPAITASPSGSPAESSSTPEPESSGSDLKSSGTHHFSGKAPSDPWPEPLKMKKVVGPLPFPPAVTQTLVGVGTAQGFDAYGKDGKIVYTAADQGPLTAAPLSDESNFYLLRARSLTALDPAGQTLWSFEFEGEVKGQALQTADNVVFSVGQPSSHQLVAVSKTTGQASWQVDLTDAPASSPVLADAPRPTVCLIDAKGTLHAWQAETGSVLWQSALGAGPSSQDPAAQGNLLVALDSAGTVRAVSMDDGSQAWEAALSTELTGSPTVTDSLVLVPSQDTYLYALDRESGVIKGKTRLSVPLSSAPVVVGDHVYQCDDSGGVHSLSLPGLALNWSKSLAKDALHGPAFSDQFWALLAADGSLLVYPR